MALAAQQTQGSQIPLMHLPLTKGLTLRSFGTLRCLRRADRCMPLNRSLRLSFKAQSCLYPWKEKRPFKILSFKGNTQTEESEDRVNSSRFSEDSVHLSYAEQKSEETMPESLDTTKVPLSYVSEDKEETVMESPAIRKLFNRWLIMINTQSSIDVPKRSFEEKVEEQPILQEEGSTLRLEALRKLKSLLGCYLRLDAAFKIPPLIFIPWYLGVRLVHGTEVSRELTPLWVLGPLVTALYIKLFQGLCSLYVWIFKETMNLIKNLPTYSQLGYRFLAEGKLKEYIRARFLQPFIDIKNLDYKEVSKKKLKELGFWAYEQYLDFIESIWPYYCRTIRFLKRASLL